MVILGDSNPNQQTSYDGDGSTSSFDIDFDYQRSADILVRVYNDSTDLWETMTLDVDYTIPSDGNTIEFVTGSIPASGAGNVELRRQTPRDVANLPTNLWHAPGPGGLPEGHNLEAFQRAMLIAQELEDQQIDGVYWLYARNWANGITSANVSTPYPVNTAVIHMGVHIPSTFRRLWVTHYHQDASPPTDWALSFNTRPAAGSTQYTRAYYPLTFGGSLVSTSEAGAWLETTSPFAETEIDVDPGQQWYLQCTGSSLDKLHMLVGVGYQRRV